MSGRQRSTDAAARGHVRHREVLAGQTEQRLARWLPGHHPHPPTHPPAHHVWAHVRECREVTKRAIIDVNSTVSGRYYDILTSIIAQLLTSRPFLDSCRGQDARPFSFISLNCGSKVKRMQALSCCLCLC